MLVFKAEADGEHELSVHDLHWSGGPFGVLRARELASQEKPQLKEYTTQLQSQRSFP